MHELVSPDLLHGMQGKMAVHLEAVPLRVAVFPPPQYSTRVEELRHTRKRDFCRIGKNGNRTQKAPKIKFKH